MIRRQIDQNAIVTDRFTSQNAIVSLRRVHLSACRFRLFVEYSESVLMYDYLLSRFTFWSTFEECRGILMESARVRVIIESRRSAA
jgi:hypothetical protein